MAKPRKRIEIGAEYGWLTVLSEAPKDAYGHIRWNVRCRCGKIYEVQTGFLSKPNCKCRDCSQNQDKHNRPRLSSVGDILNGWHILEEVGNNKAGAILYRCQCVYCGSICIKTRGAIANTQGIRCANCKPDYQFVVCGDSTTGKLPCGTEFKIDTSLIPAFQQFNWKVNDKGYIERSNRGMTKLKLHWLALGYDGQPPYTIDHINRNKTDCRSSNLRYVTAQQNSMNRNMGSNCTTGYVGVCFHKRKNRYMAKIGLNNKNIFLGYSYSPVECAQMYNEASRILFGEFCGHRNDVPPASITMQKRIQDKCRPYMVASIVAQMPCTMYESA